MVIFSNNPACFVKFCSDSPTPMPNDENIDDSLIGEDSLAFKC